MLSIIIPTYNEAESIATCLRRLACVLKGTEHEIIVADDSSPDGTADCAESLGLSQLKVLRRTGPRGLSASVADAFALARGDQIAVIDADLQHDLSILPQMVAALTVVDIVIGSRAIPDGSYGEMGFARRFVSRIAATVTNRALELQLSDPMSGYFAVRREVVDRAARLLKPRGYKILLDLILLGAPKSYSEIGYNFGRRFAGKSKLSLHVSLELLRSVPYLNQHRQLKEFHHRPLFHCASQHFRAKATPSLTARGI